MTSSTQQAPKLRFRIIGAGPTIVLLHPIAMRLEFWGAVADELAGAQRVVCCDLPGFGETARTRTPFSIDDLADDVISLARDQELGPAVFAGCSLGGMVAQGIALRAPEAVAGLVLANTSHRMSPDGAAVMRERARLARLNFGQAVETDIARWFSDDFRAAHPKDVARVREWALANDPETVALGWEAIAGLSYGDSLRRFGKPALVMTGSRDPASPPAAAKAIATALANARYVELDGAGHFAPIEQPKAFAAAVREYVARL